MNERRKDTLAGAGIAMCLAAPLALTVTCDADLLRLDQSGRLTPVASVEEALAHEDGDMVALITRQPAAAVATLGTGARAVPTGASAMQLVSNGLGVEGDTPTAVAFTPDGTMIVVAHRDSQNLVVFDTDTRDVLQTIPVSGSPNDLALSSDGRHAVTANIFEDTASIVDLAAGAETDVVPVGDQPGVVRITPDGLTAVVGNTVSGSLSVIDIAAGVETDEIFGLAFSSSTTIGIENGATASEFTAFHLADNDTVLHPERFNARVQFVDLGAGTVTSLATAANPAALDVSPDGTTAVVAHAFSTQLVSVIDVATQSVVKTIPVGVDLFSDAIVINPDKTKAIVGVLNEVRVVNLVTDAVSPNISTSGVNGLVRTGDGLYALAVGFNGALVSFATESLVANLNAQVSTNLGAASPVETRAALAGAFFTEELLVANTNGPFGFLEERVPTGPPPEGDKARHVAVSPDGTTAIAVNILSDNVSVIDLGAREVTGIHAVGDRPSEVAFTPAGDTAVIANLDSSFVSLLDVGTGVVTNVNISTRGSQVEISPDGSRAYVAVVASGDGVWRIDLDSQSVLPPRILTGNMGGIFYLYNQASGMTLSHDGATLVTCNSYTDDVSIIDTAAWDEVARVPVGDFPVRAVFSPDDSTIYVTNKNVDTISVIDNAGPASSVTGTINTGDQPFVMALTPDGEKLYVSNFGDDTLSVIALGASETVGPLIALNEPVQGLHLDPLGGQLHAAGGSWSVTIGPGPVVTLNQSGEFTTIDAATDTILEQLDTGLPPSALAYRDVNGLAAIASPHGDGVLLIDVCPGDLDGDGTVGILDFLALLAAWGPNPGHPADLDGDGVVGILDFLALLAGWGGCP